FFFTSDQDRALIARKVDTEDNVIPSSNSIMASNLFKLGHYYAHTYYGKVSRQMLLNVKEQATKYPSGYANWLNLMADFVGDYYEIAIAGTEALDKLRTINQYYFPNTLIAGSRSESSLPLMESRFVEGETLIYVCVDGTCKLPETVAERSVAQLKLGFH
ncbi:MAG: thioredoxin domain-containing protein, partial [Lutibacter sp.]|nr:thioredoxin domain-containing protein [Lutibacter sp.]